MTTHAQEIRFGEFPASSDYTASMVYAPAPMMTSVNGLTAEDKWAGPLPIALARPMEQSTPVAMAYPHVIRTSNTEFWVFMAENSTAAANRRIFMYTYDTGTRVFNWIGFITLTLGTNQTVRALRMTRYLYTTGTVACAGTSVAGAGSLWVTDGQAVGARIGFGSTDPTQISTWYTINAIPSNVQITLNNTATVASGSSYVIEELRAVMATTAATLTSGGLYIAKGLSTDAFQAAGTTIPAATTVDNIRAVYLYADTHNPAVQATTTAGGLGLDDFESWASHSVWLLTVPAATTPRVYKFNMRGVMPTIGGGRSWSQLLTGSGLATVVGTTSQTNNSRLATLGHGPGSGSKCLYFATTTRVARAPLNTITSGSTTWVADMMTEIPPGSTTTFAAGSGMAAVEDMGSIDRLLVTTTGAGGIRSYVTKYNTVSNPFDHIIFADTKQLDQSTAQGGPAHATINATALSAWSEAGLSFITRNSTATTLNHLYMVPLGADAIYADITGACIMTPKINTLACNRFLRVYINEARELGHDEFAVATESYNVQVRTAGIDDNSGGWTQVDKSGDLSWLGAAPAVQFRITFQTLGTICIPARIHSLAVTYDADDNILAELEWNLNDSNLSDGTVGFTQNAIFSGSTPNFKIDYYRSDTNALVLSQTSLGTTNGTFQWFSGSLWTGSLVPFGLGPNTVGTRRRFVPSAGLPAGINIYSQIKKL